LVKKVLIAFHSHKIKQLTDTFLTLSLKDIAKQSGFHIEDEAVVEEAVLSLIAQGKVKATIQHTGTENERGRGMVSFLDDNHEYDDATTSTELEHRIGTILQVTSNLKQLDQAFCLSGKAVRTTLRFLYLVQRQGGPVRFPTDVDILVESDI
jgi:hypothetical protein